VAVMVEVESVLEGVRALAALVSDAGGSLGDGTGGVSAPGGAGTDAAVPAAALMGSVRLEVADKLSRRLAIPPGWR